MELLVGLLILLVAALIIFLALRNKNSDEQYLFAGRNVGYFAMVATLVMTEFNSTTLIAYTASGYSAGLRALLLPCALFVCLIIYALSVAKKWKRYNGVSVAHYLEDRFGKTVGVFSKMALLFTMVLFSATYVKSLTLVFMPLFSSVNPWVLSAALVLLIIVISIFRGLRSIIRLDIISFIVVLLFFPAMVLYCYFAPLNQPNALHLSWSLPYQSLPTHFVVSLIVLATLSYVAAPWYGQKMFAARHANIAYIAVFIAAILLFFLYGLGIYATKLLMQKGVFLKDSQSALPYIIHNVLPRWLGLMAYAVIFLVAATTIASAWNAMVTIVAKKRQRLVPVRVAKKSVLLMFLFAGLSLLLSNTIVKDVFSLMWFGNIPLVSLCFAVLAGFYWKKASSFGTFVSILAGIIFGYTYYVLYGDQGDYMWHWMLVGVPLIFVAGILGSYLVPNKTHSELGINYYGNGNDY